MSAVVVRSLGIVQIVSMLALVAIFIRPHAIWSIRARLPVALILFVSSIVLLVHHLF